MEFLRPKSLVSLILNTGGSIVITGERAVWCQPGFILNSQGEYCESKNPVSYYFGIIGFIIWCLQIFCFIGQRIPNPGGGNHKLY